MRNFIKSKLFSLKTVFFFLVLLFSLLVLVAARGEFFIVEDIDCKTQYGPCTALDVDTLQKYEGKDIFFLSQDLLKSELLRDVMNRKVVVQKSFPRKLLVRIEKRKPVIALSNAVDKKQILTDIDGVLVDFSESTYLPILVVRQDTQGLYIGGSVPQIWKKVIRTYFLVYKSFGTKEAVFENGVLSTKLENDILVIFPFDKDPQVLVGALQLIVTRSRIDGKLPKVIDLRYIKPVLTY